MRSCHLTTNNIPSKIWTAPMTRSTHPNKDIEKALRHAEDHGWRRVVQFLIRQQPPNTDSE